MTTLNDHTYNRFNKRNSNIFNEFYYLNLNNRFDFSY